MWLTIYFFEENILLQRVHCHAACPVDGSLLAGALGVTDSRIFIVSAGTFGAGAGPKKKWLRFWAPHCKSFGNIEFREPPLSCLWFRLTWIPKEFLDVRTLWQNGQEYVIEESL